jgi:putative membrane protein
MSDRVKAFLHGWFVTTLGVLVATGIVDGVNASSAVSLLAASLILGILNAIIRPILFVVSLPLVIVTLGLFTFVINAVLLYFVGNVVKGFSVAGFWPALKGAILISIISVIANMILGPKRLQPISQQRGRSADSDRSGGGPVIDV